MKLKTASVLKLSALALAIAAPLMASAESELRNGNGNAEARLNIRVVIPRVLFLGVGTGAEATPLATDGTIDRVTFDYSSNPLDVGTGTAAGSITNNGEVAVKVWGNNGQVTLASNSTTTGLTNAAGDEILWSEISTTSTSASLPAPAVATGATVDVALNGSSKITNQTASWTFAFANSNDVAAGTYNGRLTYTAAMP